MSESSEKPIYCATPAFPDLGKYQQGLEEIWANRWLTNNGPVMRRFQERLAEYLCRPANELALFCNGTLALELALESLVLPKGSEIITTPFTFIATASAIRRAGYKVKFCDINPETFNINTDSVEMAITSQTSAILAVHVFGRPCDVEALQKIADQYNLKLIYDAAHAFGVEIDGKPISDFGDMSMFSLHATKVFHSCEGGLLMGDAETIAKTERLKNFGLGSTGDVEITGTNAKLSELHSLMGLLMMDELDEIIAGRKRLTEIYLEELTNVEYITLPEQSPDNVKPNYAYMPILFDNESRLLDTVKKCNEQNIFPRRYFYPALHKMTAFDESQSLPVAENIANRILCLPLYYGLGRENIKNISKIIGAKH